MTFIENEIQVCSECLSLLKSAGYPVAQVQRDFVNRAPVYLVCFWDSEFQGTVEITVKDISELMPAIENWLSKFGRRNAA